MILFAPRRVSFPDPRQALDEGIVDISDNLSVERLLEAYSFGIFPWPHEDLPTLWFSPESRGILEFAELHVPRSVQKELKHAGFTHTFNKDFDRVIEACARAPRPHQNGTWITSKLLNAYKDFHRAGYAHSLEVWREDEMVGGLYGVYVGGLFCGESMFFKRSGASKHALLQMIAHLQANGLEWMDIQMVTPLLEQFGGKYIPRDDFLRRLERAKVAAKPIAFTSK